MNKKTGEKSMEGFMHPPYKKPVGPTEKPKAYHGYRSTEPESYGAGHRKVFKDGSKKRIHFHKKK